MLINVASVHTHFKVFTSSKSFPDLLEEQFVLHSLEVSLLAHTPRRDQNYPNNLPLKCDFFFFFPSHEMDRQFRIKTNKLSVKLASLTYIYQVMKASASH